MGGQRSAGREVAAGRQPLFGLAEILAPVTVEEFLADYWEQKPLVVHREDPGYFTQVLTLEDVDFVLSTSSLNDGDLRLVAEGEELTISQLVPDNVEGRVNGLEALFEQYRSGATVNLMFLNERWPALATLTRTVAKQLSAGVHGNVYLTPPGSRGLTPHHDTHDVLVCQLHGSKSWTFHPTQTALPLQSQGFSMPKAGAGDPEREFVLRPGDMAYLPRGTVHAAKANEEASLHLTIGVNPMAWSNVLHAAVDQVSATDVRFRSSVPVGFVDSEEARTAAAARLDELLSLLATRTSAAGLIDQLSSRMLQRRPPALKGQLVDLEALSSVELTTVVRVRPELQWLVTVDDEELHLEFHGKTIDLPQYVEDELAFMVKADEFTGGDLPGSLDDAGRLVLVRQLIREGFVTTT
ncbi:MAG: bifunctional lysine-specific demethylase and histidyl-hydroxylase [Actinomycetota bacterium]|jgi:ribosomal protein L16 Arg81 hydroxylase|nr:bifunctional lysine-specific demethylase and histidyl-hydroxylase [Actinomycetota bacterium]